MEAVAERTEKKAKAGEYTTIVLNGTHITGLTSSLPLYTGLEIRRLRMNLQIPADQLADYFGVSRATLFRMEEDDSKLLSPAMSAAIEHLRIMITVREKRRRQDFEKYRKSA